MKNFLFPLLLPALLFAQTAWDGTANTAWYTGSGSAYTITTAEQLAGLAKLVNEGDDFEGITITLGANIVLNDTNAQGGWKTWSSTTTTGLRQWTPIGNATNQFIGNFDGDGYVISGLFINSANDYQGLFGYAGKVDVFEGNINGLGLVGCYVKGGRNVGSLGGRIWLNKGVTNSYAICNVAGTEFVGGLIGEGDIYNSYFIGRASGTTNFDYKKFGGLSGDEYSYIINSYSVGETSGFFCEHKDSDKGLPVCGLKTSYQRGHEFFAELQSYAWTQYDKEGELYWNWKYNSNGYPTLVKFSPNAREVEVTWDVQDSSKYEYTGDSIAPKATPEATAGNVELEVLGKQVKSGGPYTAVAVLKEFKDDIILTNVKRVFEIEKVDVKIGLEPIIKASAADWPEGVPDTAFLYPSNEFCDEDNMKAILESRMKYDGFKGGDSVSVFGNEFEITIDIDYGESCGPRSILGRLSPAGGAATATIVTSDTTADNYTIQKITTVELAAVLQEVNNNSEKVFCKIGGGCVELAEEFCTASNGQSLSACPVPILLPQLSTLSYTKLPTYYSLRGTPLGTQKPKTPGIYIEIRAEKFQPKQVRKILVK